MKTNSVVGRCVVISKAVDVVNITVTLLMILPHAKSKMLENTNVVIINP